VYPRASYLFGGGREMRNGTFGYTDFSGVGNKK